MVRNHDFVKKRGKQELKMLRRKSALLALYTVPGFKTTTKGGRQERWKIASKGGRQG